MANKILLKAGLKRHKSILISVCILMLLVSVSLGTVLTIWASSAQYLTSELSRAGYGKLTTWVSGMGDVSTLTSEISRQSLVKKVETQSIIFASYTANGQKSDSEGQLISYEQSDNRYKFFANNLLEYESNTPVIASGEVYVSPSFISMYGIAIGDTISFAIARNGGDIVLSVKGFYEDPFMGSSMIGMKGFLISPQDAMSIEQMISRASVDALAKNGAMLHIFSDDFTTVAQLNTAINQNTSLASYIEFTHSNDAIKGFMLVLQNAFIGLLMAFVAVLLIVVLVALGHGITSNIEADYTNMGILKAMGFTSARLRQIQLMQYLVCVLPSMLLGIVLAIPASRIMANATLTTTGMLMPTALPIGICIIAFGAIIAILCVFIWCKTAKINHITPMNIIGGRVNKSNSLKPFSIKINGDYLNASLAVRQLTAGKAKYISVCIVAMLLVFFACTISSMHAWLGEDGKGMMDAFNPADHHIGVQMFGESTLENAKEITTNYTDITDSYQLAMVSVSVNGIDYTANVITQPQRFHVLRGRTSMADNEIVVTEFVAADLGVSIGDAVTLAGDKGDGEYIISGIYSCANDMGDNIGMSREGYLRIAQDSPQIWCDHYFLADSSQNAEITKALTDSFGGDVHVHENTWPGLKGIIVAMRALVAFMYVMVVIFVLIITTMTASKLLTSEQKDMGIYKVLGFTNSQLRQAFALRFGIIAALGSLVGVILSTMLTDALVSAIMKLAGISNFATNPNIVQLASVAMLVTILFFAFAYVTAAKIKRTDLTVLITE